MKASEIIAQLQQAIAEHGDLECTVEDGLDPSDPVIITEIETNREDFFEEYGHRNVNLLHFHLS